VQSPRRARQGAAKINARTITPMAAPKAAERKDRWPTLPASVRTCSRQTFRWLGTLVTLTLAGVLTALLTGLLQHQGNLGHQGRRPPATRPVKMQMEAPYLSYAHPAATGNPSPRRASLCTGQPRHVHGTCSSYV
jgi:hypothetical protein